MRRRPSGWVPSGPWASPLADDPEMAPGDDETLDCLSGHWKIFQLRKGHRFSTDDLLTAWFAVQCCLERGLDPRRHLDLGCGIGSVLLLVLWRLPAVWSEGIEAQPLSASLARRSLRYNGVGGRAEVRLGDFRRDLPSSLHAGFDLVTGSPPYLTAGEGRRSDLPQRGPCRFEDRGGTQDYLAAASAHLRPGGIAAWVHATRYRDANLSAAESAGLGGLRVRRVVFREGKESLITLFAGVAGLSPGASEDPPLVVRLADGRWSEEFRALRREMGFPA